MTQQEMFGGFWTQQKLRLLSDYLKAYTKIFAANENAQYFETTYLDAFAGTGEIPRPGLGLFSDNPELLKTEEEFRKGSAKRALEVKPPFDHYVFVEKDAGKCQELEALKAEFPDRDVTVINGDANVELPKWCSGLRKRDRAVVFIDPFGAALDWSVIEAIAATKAVDLWILFPFEGINRMLPNEKMPDGGLADRLTRFFGTDEWKGFYSKWTLPSIIESLKPLEEVRKTADPETIISFYRDRLAKIFAAVAEPGYLRSGNKLLFVLFFAAGNLKGGTTGLKIANDLIRGLSQF